MAERGFLRLSLRDYDGEATVVAVRSTTLSLGNWTAQSIARGLFISAAQGISLGLRVSQEFGNRNLENIGKAAAVNSQRELKWLIRFHDATTLKRQTLEFGCANVSLLDPNRRGFAKLDDGGAMAFFVSQFQGFVLTDDGHAPVIDSIELVGRAV
jgi:hypothetical protein